MEGLAGIRFANEDDLRFVSSAWFESYWKLTASKLPISFETYKFGQDARIRKLISRSVVKVAYALKEPDEILGFSVVEGLDSTAVHYAYVKSAYRRQHVGTALCRDSKWYTHITGNAGQRFCEALKLQYDPYEIEE